MSRTSRYNYNNRAQSSAIGQWRAAVYVRLSREDGDRPESESVSMQRSMLLDFIDGNDDIELYKVYIDDGWSGTSFERPQFEKMMQDVQSRAVNCVIVKDLSRFGRNYIDSGQYLEKVFPLLGVRFISVNDRLDSYRDPTTMNNIIVPFRNIINDEYCRDISNKVRSSLDTRRRQGKFIGSFSAYGYKKDPADHNHLIIDDEAAEVVRDIYLQFIGGASVKGIAKNLNAAGILNPTAYKQSKGMDYRHPTGSDGLWADSSVRRILRNEVYTGNLVQGKNRVISYKVQVCAAVNPEDWITVENTHEAIVTNEIFDKAQSLFYRDTRAAPDAREVYLLSGFVKCADCGRAMNRKTVKQPYGTYNYYICSTYKKGGACTKHTIRGDKIETAVLETIRAQIALAIDADKLIKQIGIEGRASAETERLGNLLKTKQREIDRIICCKADLYPDWKAGIISKDEYTAIRAKLNAELEAAEKAIAETERLINEKKDGIRRADNFIDSFIKYKNIDRLTREILVELVEDIHVSEGGGITIEFKFADTFLPLTADGIGG